VGGRISYDGWACNGYNTNNSANHHITTHCISGLMCINFTYVNKKNVQVYSGTGLGMRYRITKENDTPVDGEETIDRIFHSTVSGFITPIGVHVGNDRVFGLAEVSLGTEAIISVGIGGHF